MTAATGTARSSLGAVAPGLRELAERLRAVPPIESRAAQIARMLAEDEAVQQALDRARVLSAIESGKAPEALRLAVEIKLVSRKAVRRYGTAPVVEAVWNTLRHPRLRLGPTKDVRLSILRKFRQHAAQWGTETTLGAADRDRLEIDRARARNLRKGQPWARLERVNAEPDSIAPNHENIAESVSLVHECLRSTRSDEERNLVLLLARESVLVSEALRATKVSRSAFRALQRRIFRARVPKVARGCDMNR